MGKIGDLWVRLGLKSDEFRRGIGDAEKQTRSLGQRIKQNWQAITAGVAAAAVAVKSFVNAYRKIAEFEQANANLATIMGRSVKEIERLTKSAMELGRTTAFTASQVTELQTELAKLGFGEGQILDMEEAVLNFSTAVGTDLANAAAFAGSTLRIFGLSSKDTEDVLDVLASATNKSALNFSYLSTAMSIVGPVAKTFGFSVRDTAALLGTLANAGFDASSAATATRNILLNLANANGKLAKSLGHGVSNIDELLDGLKELKDKGVDLNTTLALTDKRSVAAFNTFLEGTEATRQLREELDNVGGASARIANDRLDTVAGSVKLMQSAWEGFVLSFSSSKGAIKSVIDMLTAGIEAVTLKMSGDARSGAWKSTYMQSYQDSISKYGEEWTKEYMRQQLEAQKKRAEQEKRENDNAPLLNRLGNYIKGGIATNVEQDRYQGMLEAFEQLFENQGGSTTGSGTGAGLTGGEQDWATILAEMTAKQKKDQEKKKAEDALKAAKEGLMSERELLTAHYEENLALLEKYGLDTSALTQKYWSDLVDITEKEVERQTQSIADGYDDLAKAMEESIDTSYADQLMDEFLQPLMDATARAEELAAEFTDAVVGGFSDGCQELMDQLTGLSELNAGAILQAVLSPLADMAVREGEILIAQGIGVEACKEALRSLNGIAAIAAGTALVAIGTAARSGLAALANRGSRGTSTSSSYAGSTLNEYTESTELVVRVEGRLSGSDILFAGERAAKALGR